MRFGPVRMYAMKRLSILMHLVYVNKTFFFPYIQVDNTLIILPWTVLNS